MSAPGPAQARSGTLTEGQADLFDRLLSHFDGSPHAGAIVVAFDVSKSQNVQLGSTAGSPGILFVAGLLLLRSCREALRFAPDGYKTSEMLEAVRTALPFLEAAGTAEPAACRDKMQ